LHTRAVVRRFKMGIENYQRKLFSPVLKLKQRLEAGAL
jgi:hypothetical protein